MEKIISSDPKRPVSLGPVPSEAATYLESGDFNGLENLLLSKLEQSQEDVAFFLPIIRAFIKRRDQERADVILQLILDGLRQKNSPDAEIALAQQVLSFWPDNKLVRDILLGHLKKRYANSPNLSKLLAHVGVEKSPETLSALRRLEMWLRCDEGTIVYIAGKGAGKVSEINPTLNVVRVSLPSGILSTRIEEADRILEPLEQDHFMYQKVTNSDALREKAAADPIETVAHIFRSFKKPLTVSELKEILDGIVSSAQWNTWWKKARTDRRLTVGTGTKPLCSWNDSAEDADEAILREFQSADAGTRLELARKYSGRSEKLSSMMIDGLRDSWASIMSDDPSTALSILLALQKMPGLEAASVQQEIDTLLSAADPVKLILSIDDRGSRRNAVMRAKEVRSDWQLIYLELFIDESDAGILSLVYETLQTEASDKVNRIISETLSEPVRSPRLFSWLCHEMMKRAELRTYAGWALVQALLKALGDDMMKQYHATLRKTFDPGGVGAFAVGQLDTEQARQLLTLLDRSASLEDYRREAIRKDLNLRFRDLQGPDTSSFFATAESIRSRQEEYERVMKVEIPENTEEIKKAEEHGDLRENFEYHAAKNRHAMLASRARTLAEQLDNAKIINFAAVDTSAINIGTTVTLKETATGKDQEITILGPWESDPDKGIYSYQAPAVASLLDSKRGDTVTFNVREYRVEEIRVWRKES